jgi:hypothetical protein
LVNIVIRDFHGRELIFDHDHQFPSTTVYPPPDREMPVCEWNAAGANPRVSAYEVTKQLPHNGREFEYRVKSASEEHERVIGESELTKE